MLKKYDEDYCKIILKKHGWVPRPPAEGHPLQKDWVLMAFQIAILEKLDKRG